MQTTLTRIFIVLKSVSHGLSENWDEISRKARKFTGIFLPKLGGLQKKRSSPKLRLIYRPKSEIQTFEEGCFPMGGLYLIFHKKSASKPPKTCDFAYFTSLRYWVESSRTSLASRTSSRTHFEVLGLEGQVLGLGLEVSSPRKLTCPRLKDSTIFLIVKILWSAWKIFVKTFFFLESTCACVLGPWPWLRAFLSLASRVSVLA